MNKLIYLSLIILISNSSSVYSQQFIAKEMLEKKSNIILESFDLSLETHFSDALENYNFNIINNYQKDNSDKKTYKIVVSWNTRPALKCGGKIIMDLNGKIYEYNEDSEISIGQFLFSQEFYKGMCHSFIFEKLVEKMILNY